MQENESSKVGQQLSSGRVDQKVRREPMDEYAFHVLISFMMHPHRPEFCSG